MYIIIMSISFQVEVVASYYQNSIKISCKDCTFDEIVGRVPTKLVQIV